MKNKLLKKRIVTGISLCLTGLLLHINTPSKVFDSFLNHGNQTVSTASHDKPDADHISFYN